ncbi:hypothetical protein QZH41_019662 [Actinostola sp. cb2023]|nr:hypothetical protein QZH41_019662 [Actinostola sp. cb2023]
MNMASSLSRIRIPRRASAPLCRSVSSFFNTDYTPPRLSYVSPENDVLYDHSIRDAETFWGQLGAQRLQWKKPFDRVMDCDMNEGRHRWFLGGQINVSENCVDRHMRSKPNHTALIWEKDEPGDVEHVSYIVVFAGFSADALSSRINDAQAETVITSDQILRAGKVSELKRVVDEAVSKSPGVKRVFVMKRTGGDVPMGKLDIPLEEAMSEHSVECEPEALESEDPLFLLYTSGSTGQPKGIVHTQAGYLLYTNLTMKYCFDYQPGDIFGCVADVGWITGHSYVVYGPLSNGATSVLFESTPTYPDPGRYWDMVERLKLTQFYGSPTAVRLLLKSGDSHVAKYDRSSLRVLGTVGEPINAEAWHWYNDVVGEKRCTVVDTWWQTETGGIFISPRPSAFKEPVKPEFPMRPFFGVEPVLMDEKGKELIGNNVKGALCFRASVPGMCRTIYGHHERYLDTYYRPYPGFYFTGDGALRDKDGHYRITGRMDDVINVSGKRLGTAEVEDAMDNHEAVAETAVVGFPHPIKGEGIYAYATLKDNADISPEQLRAELKKLVRAKIGAFAVPEIIQVCTCRTIKGLAVKLVETASVYNNQQVCRMKLIGTSS